VVFARNPAVRDLHHTAVHPGAAASIPADSQDVAQPVVDVGILNLRVACAIEF
jgi:hypothetical protein